MSELYDALVNLGKKKSQTLLLKYSGTVLHTYNKNQIYLSSLDKEHYVCVNIVSNDGFTVIDKKSYQIYMLINNNSIDDISNRLLREGDLFNIGSIVSIIQKLQKRHLIWITKPYSPVTKQYGSDNKITVWFHLTNSCNLRCNYCFVNKTVEHMSDEMVYQVIDKIFASAVKKNIKEVAIGIAGGEPLLRPKQVEILLNYAYQKAEQAGIKFSPGIATNGTLITESIARLLKKNNVFVKLSLDGLGNFNDINRHFENGSGSYGLVMKGIKHLQEQKVRWGINTVVTKRSVKGLPQYVTWLLKNNILFNISFFRDNPVSPEKQNLLNKAFLSNVKKAYKIIEHNIPPYSLLDFILDRTTFSKPHRRCCGIGLNYLVINQKGQILSCPLFGTEIIGDIELNDPIDTMINNCIVPKEIEVDRIDECKSCIWRFYCAGGCPLLTKYNFGQYNKPTPVCYLIKKLAPDVVKIEGKRILKYNLQENLILYG